ncbi:6-carboxy-5,6,7,8-tetrahydropterin synthase [Crateriforma conspicua]|uniref:6-carboxy-5,6,7,8-tetrahydropterin synthase n=1 Tax=Crateriforma conspicua TaxID=2527996 RepID=A0A5C6FXT9_9PLAN|nr:MULTISPECIES: 6-pyruvoyl tetrahydropterin synthase family protein [Crateriforma]TWU66138.1 6-carboxy-5,6,7,8-tetrahydropterin synthase [Crateriforma conspicua]
MTHSTEQPVFRVDVSKEQFVFSAAHFITFAGDICERIHGHNYGVRVSVEGPLDENRYVVDFIALRDAVLAETGSLDHHVLLPDRHAQIRVTKDEKETTATFRDRRWVFPNEDCVHLPVTNTTAEELAEYIGRRVIDQTFDKFGDHLSWIEVAVDENQGQWGVCRLPWKRPSASQ